MFHIVVLLWLNEEITNKNLCIKKVMVRKFKDTSSPLSNCKENKLFPYYNYFLQIVPFVAFNIYLDAGKCQSLCRYFSCMTTFLYF